MQTTQNKKWLHKETKKIQQTAQVTPEEAEEILKQRILDHAKSHNISEEEAAVHYNNVHQNTKIKTL